MIFFAFFGFMIISVLVLIAIFTLYNKVMDLRKTLQLQRKELSWYRQAAQRGHVKPYPGNIVE